MKEIVIFSGKGGTGKTSLTSALASLASAHGKLVFADCDVDAADLHLIFKPEIQRASDFISGHEAIIQTKNCTACGLCAQLCRFEAIRLSNNGDYLVDGCEGCGVCVQFCLAQAILFPERYCGQWYESNSRFGPLVHARLEPAAENSGKLVSLVRREARRLAETIKADYLIADGCPGIGCPVIASLTGADLALAVTEPSLSGQHDLERAVSLARQLQVPLLVAVNKADINPAQAQAIKRYCEQQQLAFAGMVNYDQAVTQAQLQAKSIIEYDSSSLAAQQITALWEQVKSCLN